MHNNTSSHAIIVGMQFSDEGKGRAIDNLSKHYNTIVRYHGGPSAGATICFNNKSFIARTIPAGIINPHMLCLIDSGVIIDPIVFAEEIAECKKL